MLKYQILNGGNGLKNINKIIWFLLISFLILGGVADCMKKKLTNEEKEWFANIPEFNKTLGEKGFKLSDRELKDENLSGIKLRQSLLENVDFIRVRMVNCGIYQSRLKNVTFGQANVSGSNFEDVVFESCQFTISDFSQSSFLNCTFRGCEFEESKMDISKFTECAFENITDNTSDFGRTHFTNVTFNDSKLMSSSFFESHFKTVQWNDNKLVETNYSYTQGEDISIVNCYIENSGFTESNFKNISFENIEGIGLGFARAKLEGLVLKKSRNFDEFSLISCQLKNTSLIDNQNLSDAAFFESIFESFTINNTSFNLLSFQESKVSGTSLFKDCVFAGMNLSQNHFKDLYIENSTFKKFLVLKQSQFENLHLKNNKFDKDLRITDDGVVYTESDTFERQK